MEIPGKKMQQPGKPHWQGRRRHVSRERIAWYGEPGDERYWYEYWRGRLTADYYAAAQNAALRQDELGQILLRYLSPRGLHLEAGCGAGYWVAALHRQGLKIEGIEYARELVELVQGVNPQLPVKQGNALAIACPDDSYDSYLSIGVVEHRLEGPEPFLLEAFRVLKPGGKILIAVPYFGPARKLKGQLFMYERQRPALPFFQYGFSKQEFTRILRKAGFYVEYVQPLYVHRLMQEELPGYNRLTKRAPFVRRLAERLLLKKDGHMLLAIGQKPENFPLDR
ncbi:MAG TPA: class I SAM-dependent methyltransferase [Ktedonobacteraceae bacterium]|nr:class I SAM-dependent methyltransferase [Ktedonobacteraceae bacterium]